MAVAIVPALAQDGVFGVVPAPSLWLRARGADGGFLVGEPLRAERAGPLRSRAGVLLVTYYSKEAMWAASQENVRETSPRLLP